MYPQLFNMTAQAAQRLSPMLSRLLARGGSFASPTWKTGQIDFPGVHATPQVPLDPNMPRPPTSTDNTSTPPNYSVPSLPSWVTGAQHFMPSQAPTQAPAPQPAQQPSPAPQSVPMPMPRPDQAPAPQQPDTGFFARNAAMMRDPSTGQFIDPSAAQSVRGPDLINKMMAYLHNKDMG